MGLFDAVFQQGGILSRFVTPASATAAPPTPSSGILGNLASMGVLQQRLSVLSTAPTPIEKVSALVGTLGMRLRPSTSTPPATAPATTSGGQMQSAYMLPPPPFQAAPMMQASSQRVILAGESPTVSTPAVQFA